MSTKKQDAGICVKVSHSTEGTSTSMAREEETVMAEAKEGVSTRIDPRLIHVSTFQHRTVFDPVEMEELRKDVTRNGIHTALIVRKHAGIEGEFELATGERRLRIALELHLQDVPVFIREMTDRQMEELQWSENFRRVNPDPLDEGGGLSRMLKYHKTVDGLARYIGKPKAYVLTRLQLLKLIPAIQEMVHARVFNLKESLGIATLAPDTQLSFFDKYCADWKKKKVFRVPNLSEVLQQFRCDLSQANFDPKDKDLVPEAGACTHCPYNSATYHSLFPETEKTSLCSRQSCFVSKCVATLRRELAEVIAEYPPTALVSDEPIGKMWQSILGKFPEIAALPRFSYYDIFSVDEPSAPDRADFECDEDEGGFDEEGFSEAMDEYRAEQQEFDQALRDGKLHRGLYLEADCVQRILFDPDRPHTLQTNTVTTTAAAVQHAIKAGTATPQLLQGEMSRIRERETRSIELDSEKVQKSVYKHFTARLNAEDVLPELTSQDQLGIRLLIYQALNYGARVSIEARIPRREADGERKPFPLTDWLAGMTDAQVALMAREALSCHQEASNPKTDTGKVLLLMAEGIGLDVAGVQAAQAKIAETRSSRVSDRLSALQQRVEALEKKEAANTTPVAA